MASFGKFTRRQFVAGVGATAAATLTPLRLMAKPMQDPVVDTTMVDGKAVSHDKVQWRALPFPMKHVRLLPGPCTQAMEENRKYLHTLPTDRLAHMFRVTAGIPSTAQPFGGWEAPDCELRGHFAGGHYLSAVALMYASTGDEDLRKKGDALVAALAECQKKHADGYLSAFPPEFFDRLSNREKVWAPFYTIHKIMAGHLDMYVHTGNTQALDTVEKMAGWVGAWTGPMSYDHMQRILQTEFGGMGEVLRNLYAVTGKWQYLGTARHFDHQFVLDPLAEHRDELKGLHANTNIPKIIAAARGYELVDDQREHDIAQYFWDEVTSERCYCTGGTSNGEFWRTDPGKLAKELGPTTTEDCCAYNMMKLTRHVFGWHPSAHYMDYYERTLFNHRLGTINPETGTTMYYLPLGTGYWKVFATDFNSFWCCSGTGVEEYSKLNDTIYFHDDNSVYVNLYIASELNWPEKKFRLRQDTQFPQEQGMKLTVLTDSPDIALNVRIPYWTQGGSVKVNGRTLPVFANPSSYLTLRGPWKAGDTIEFSFPMGLHVHPMPDDHTIQAAMYGPLVLAGKLDEVTPKMMFGDYGPKGNVPTVPDIQTKKGDVAEWVVPEDEKAMKFKATAQTKEIELVPLNQVLQNKYVVYWKVNQEKKPFERA